LPELDACGVEVDLELGGDDAAVLKVHFDAITDVEVTPALGLLFWTASGDSTAGAALGVRREARWGGISADFQ
jgi:hypothetical protein